MLLYPLLMLKSMHCRKRKETALFAKLCVVFLRELCV